MFMNMNYVFLKTSWLAKKLDCGWFPSGRDQVLVTLGVTEQTWGKHIQGDEPVSASQLRPGAELLL